MLDLDGITGFEWDEGNTRKSVDKHAVRPLEAEEVFADPRLLIVQDVRHSHDEARYQALGKSAAGRGLFVAFTFRENGTRIRIISSRPMSRKERAIYGQEA